MDANALILPKTHQPVSALTQSEGEGSSLGRPVTSMCQLRFVSDVVEIFKKTPYAADLKPAGRDVAKDMLELDSMIVQDTIEPKIVVGRPGARQTEWQSCATRRTRGVMWKFVWQDEAARLGGALRWGRAHEKQCYADV